MLNIQEYNAKTWTGLNWLKIRRPIIGFCEHSDVLSGFIKAGNFLITCSSRRSFTMELAFYQCG
jgi:hypothetical protein